jgi:hypothetical protein
MCAVARLRPALALAGLTLTAAPGCAVVVDMPDGRRHVLGYHASTIPPSSPDADAATEVEALDVVGLALLIGPRRAALVAGALSERRVALAGDAAVSMRCLECRPQDIVVRRLDPGASP